MKYVVLDTSFILSCVRKKIDFFDRIKFMGLKILIPIQVIEELTKISGRGNAKFSGEAKLALVILKKSKCPEIDLHNKNVDKGIIKIAGENKEYIIATLDREIKNKTNNQKLVIRGEKELEIIG